MAITSADVTGRFAEFANISAGEFTLVLADVALQVNSDNWGSKADLASIYLAAHLLGMAHPDLVPTPQVVREAMDGVRYTYATAQLPAAVGALDATPYGRLYKSLRAQVRVARGIVP